MSIFLDPSDVATLTGQKRKARQIAALRDMKIAFFITPSGRPVVTKSAIEGKIEKNETKPKWQPAVLNHG